MPSPNPFYETAKDELRRHPHTWLVTGAAGFIGSHLVEALLRLDQCVIGLDNLSSGKPENLDAVRSTLKPIVWSRFQFIQGDIRDAAVCQEACQGVELVLHHAAFCSVPASIENPAETHATNVTGFVNLLEAARHAGVLRLVYASSSAVYGDSPDLPHVEERLGNPLSPYALSKYVDELHARLFARTYGFSSVGLRYFNVFGPRQDPNSAYAAVIPRWIQAARDNEDVIVYGDGETTRDFCFVENVVQANILAATIQDADAANQVYNIGSGQPTSLNALWQMISALLEGAPRKPSYLDFRPGDVRHSHADIAKATRLLRFQPLVPLSAGLERALAWYRQAANAISA
jgi:UDP-N-acetylglucosamine/UDP-N-acetylgalactosamine 4-epimerase